MKKSRRDVLKIGALTGAGLVLPSLSSAQTHNMPTQTPNTRVPVQGGVTFHGHVSRPAAQLTTAAGTLTQFVDQLPIMPVLRPSPWSDTHPHAAGSAENPPRPSANTDLGLQRHLAGSHYR